MVLLILAFVLITVIAGLVIYARWHYGTLEKMGIPMVGKPFLIFGNTLDMFSKPGGFIDIEHFKKFGPIYGVYEGRSPQVHICDAELIRLVTTKDAEYFNDKRRLDFRNPLLNEMPDFQPYEKWKVIRNFLTPALSSAKIKAMSESQNASMENFCNRLKESIRSSPGQKLEKYHLRDEYFAMLTDMIARCFFSVQIENPSDPNNVFVNLVRGLLQPDGGVNPFLEVLAYSFPFLYKFMPSMWSADNTKGFEEVFTEMIRNRKKSGEKIKDVIDLCLEQMEKLDSPDYKRLGINQTTIVCQALVFFMAGQDQISIISSALIYFLLQNPETEKKVYEEIDAFLKKHNGKILYENLHDLQYLTAALNESLRFYPFFSRTERVCTKPWENKEFGLKINPGTTVIIPLWAANRNPKYFEDPEKFNPDRFLPGNKEKLHPYALTSFGFGPRNCIGSRFSLDTMLLMNAHIFKNFKFHLRPDSKIEFAPAGPFFTPNLPFYFDVSLRN